MTKKQKGSKPLWGQFAGRLVKAGLLFSAVTAGLLLLNPAVLGEQVEEESRQVFDDGTILKHRLVGDPETGRLTATLELESFQGQTDEERSGIRYAVKLQAIPPEAICVKGTHIGQADRPDEYLDSDAPLPATISSVEVDWRDSGRQFCYGVRMGNQEYLYRTDTLPEIKTRSVPERPVLQFGQQIEARGTSYSVANDGSDYGSPYVRLSLSLRATPFYPGRLPSRTAMIIQYEPIGDKEDCQSTVFGSWPNPNTGFAPPEIHVSQVAQAPLWETDSILIDDTSKFVCWRIWVDPERDDQNWQAYYYAGPRLPRVWDDSGSPLIGDDENTAFHFSLAESGSNYRITMNLTHYGNVTGQMAQVLDYSLKAKPVDRQSDCRASNFTRPGESLGYIEASGEIDWVPQGLVWRYLPDPNAYSEKFICFRVLVVPSGPSWSQIAQGQYQTFYYSSDRLPEISGPAFSHRVRTQLGRYPELTLSLQSLGQSAGFAANVDRVIVGPVARAADCHNAGGREILSESINVRPPAALVQMTLSGEYDGQFACFDVSLGGSYYRYMTERIELDSSSLAFDHEISTQPGQDPEITLRLLPPAGHGQRGQTVEINRIAYGRADQAEGCQSFGGWQMLNEPINVRPPAVLATATLDSHFDGQFICFYVETAGGLAYRYHTPQRIDWEALISGTRPVFSHEINTRPGYWPEVTLRLEPFEGGDRRIVSVDSVFVGRPATDGGSGDCSSSITGQPILDTPGDFWQPAVLATASLDYEYAGEAVCFHVQMEGKRYAYSAGVLNLDFPDLPARWTLDEALALFRRQLTTKSLRIIDNVDFYLHPNGCPDKTEENPSGGCWISGKPLGLGGSDIYLNDGLFSVEYIDLSNSEKLRVIKRTMQTLTHESLHAAEDEIGDLKDKIQSCYRGNDGQADPIGDFLAWYSQNKAGNRLSYVEQLPAATEACLHGDATWGAITKALKDLYEGTADKSSLSDVPAVWGRYYDEPIELFSMVWYVEFHAALGDGRASARLPSALEEHYNLYVKDWRDYRDTIQGVKHYFKF